MIGILRIEEPGWRSVSSLSQDAASGRKEYTDDRITDLPEPAPAIVETKPPHTFPRASLVRPCYLEGMTLLRLPTTAAQSSLCFYALIKEGMYAAVTEPSRARAVAGLQDPHF